MFELVKKCLEKGKKCLEKGKKYFEKGWVSATAAVTAAVTAVGVGVVGVASPANAAMTSLIDFSALASDLTPLITTAVTVAAGLGALILAARLCWGFFKKFTKG